MLKIDNNRKGNHVIYYILKQNNVHIIFFKKNYLLNSILNIPGLSYYSCDRSRVSKIHNQNSIIYGSIKKW